MDTVRFFAILHKHLNVPFSWDTNMCAQFVANVYSELYGREFGSVLRTLNVTQENYKSVVADLGGWPQILDREGLIPRADKAYHTGDVVVGEEGAIGLWTGRFAAFAGKIYKRRGALVGPGFYYPSIFIEEAKTNL